MNPNHFFPALLPSYQSNSFIQPPPPQLSQPLIHPMIPQPSVQIINPYSNIIPALAAPYIPTQSSSNNFVPGLSVPFAPSYLPPTAFGGNLSFPGNFHLQQPSLIPQQSTAFQQNLGIPSALTSSASQQQLVQFSLPPSIPQPKCILIDGVQYLEFLPQLPGESAQYIPLQVFLRPSDTLAATPNTGVITSSSLNMNTSMNSQSNGERHKNVASTSRTSLDSVASPPSKVRKTLTPNRKSTSFVHQKLDRFLIKTPPSAGNKSATHKNDSDSEIEVLSETINKNAEKITQAFIKNEVENFEPEVLFDKSASKKADVVLINDAPITPKPKEATKLPSNSKRLSLQQTQQLSAIENRIRMKSPLNDIAKTIPVLDVKVVSDIAVDVVPIIVEVIPNAIINSLGPALHNMGAFYNVSVNEETKETESVWFFFTLSILVGNKKKEELETPSPEQLIKWIEEIERKAKAAEVVIHTERKTQRNVYKLSMEHRSANAKLTLLFNSSNALKRSQLIRLYRRCDPRMVPLAFLYNNLVLIHASLHSFTNTPICYLIIYFLQQTDRLKVLHEEDPQILDNINVFTGKDIGEQGDKYLNPGDTSVAIAVYDFAKFYSQFDFEKIVIDISRKSLVKWTKEMSATKHPVTIKCSFSGKNLASSVTSVGLASFVQKLKDIIKAFEFGKEAEIFASNLDEFARKPMKVSKF